MSINGQGHSLTLVKGHSDFKVKCLTFGLYTQVSDSGPLGPLVNCDANTKYMSIYLPFRTGIDSDMDIHMAWLPWQTVCLCRPGPGCSKLTTSLVNETLKFQMLISQICQYFLLKKM